jgi:DNA-binding IclR family transcriptional regulator
MIGRVVSLLDAVAETRTTSRRRLAQRTGLPQATCNRIVARLIAQRWLAEGPDGLRLGLRLFELGTEAAQAGVTLLDVAGPYLLDLYGALGWTAQLAVLDGDTVTYLLKTESHRRPRLDTRVGERFPPHCTGAGKALLAFSPPEVVDRVLDRRATLVARTPATITSRSRLLSDLRATRRRGYAIDNAEFQPEMVGVAVPIRPDLRLVGALTLTGPSASFDPTRAAHAARIVARMIEARLAVRP